MDASPLTLITYILIGIGVTTIISLIPSLHIYNVMGLIIIAIMTFGDFIPAAVIPYMFMAMLVTYSVLNTLTAIFLSAPDESMIFVVMPGQKALTLGRAYEISMLTGFGSLLGVLLLVLITPLSFNVLPALRRIMTPHMHWLLGLVTVYILMSEWPKSIERKPPGLSRFFEAWRSLGAGLLTFALSGFLGLIVFNKTMIPIRSSFQSLLPVFVGLFAVPSILLNIISKQKIPKQHIAKSIDVTPSVALRSTIAGGLGGLIAALFPIMTAGMGGLIAGQATAQRDNRIFVMSQGVSKVVYYVGAFLFFFVPGKRMGKGGLVAMVSPLFSIHTIQEYWLALATMVFAGGIAFILLHFLSKWFAKIVHQINYQLISIITLGILLLVVFGMTRWMGLLIMTVSTAIGLLPVLFGSRRLNCLGVLLVPITLNMAGIGPKVAQWLGIV
ncbi:tripartite tricarboxylate transporter permease [bacterium]|nr:tripartite tricarboxylate transporter permease [bacterium]